jgi:hypothetical protein
MLEVPDAEPVPVDELEAVDEPVLVDDADPVAEVEADAGVVILKVEPLE